MFLPVRLCVTQPCSAQSDRAGVTMAQAQRLGSGRWDWTPGVLMPTQAPLLPWVLSTSEQSSQGNRTNGRVCGDSSSNWPTWLWRPLSASCSVDRQQETQERGRHRCAKAVGWRTPFLFHSSRQLVGRGPPIYLPKVHRFTNQPYPQAPSK